MPVNGRFNKGLVMSTEIVKMPSTGIIQKVGNEKEREYLMQVYAGMLGIPSSQASKTEVQAVIGKAVQRSVQYGWQPGVHMHTVGFWRKAQQGETPERQDGKVYEITLVDGEKAWWDSAARWRDERGIDWTPKYKNMTRQEVEHECKLQNMPFNDGCYGVYCKIVVKGEIGNMLSLYGVDERTPVKDRMAVVNALIDEIPWAAGVYTGKKRTGKYLNDDNLPTGTSAKDVAMRRAGKRAIMQSSLTLIPLDNFTEEQRVGQLTVNLRKEAQFQEQSHTMIAQRPEPVREEDGSLFFASIGEDADFYREVKEARAGRGRESQEDGDVTVAEWAAIPGAEPKRKPKASHNGSTPKPAQNGDETEGAAIEYAHLYSELSDNAKKLVDWTRTLQNNSDGPATDAMIGTLKGCIKAAASENTRKAIVEIMIGSAMIKPGYKVAKELIDVLKKTEGRGDAKRERSEYRQDVADIVHYLGELVAAYRESQKVAA